MSRCQQRLLSECIGRLRRRVQSATFEDGAAEALQSIMMVARRTRVLRRAEVIADL
jgi:hypothetical protein